MRRFFLIIFLVVILFAACCPCPEEIALQTQVDQIAMTASWTITPTITPTYIPTYTPLPMPTQTPTSTPVPCSYIDLTGKWRGFVRFESTSLKDVEIIIDLIQNNCEVSGIYSTWDDDGNLRNVNENIVDGRIEGDQFMFTWGSFYQIELQLSFITIYNENILEGYVTRLSTVYTYRIGLKRIED